MRKLIVFLFLICACAFAQAQQKPAAQATTLPWCRLGVDPVDATRQPNWATECVIKAPTTPVTMMTGSGRRVRCILPPLTPIVVDRVTGAARWVLACGNPILSPANWVPQGTRICGPETAQPATQTAAPPAPASPAQPVTPAEVRVVHSGEVRHVHEIAPSPASEPTPTPVPTPQPKKGWWARNAKWVVPVAVAAGTGVAIASRGGQKTVTYQPLPPPLYRP